MVRTEFLKLLVHQAARNGFDFERWYPSWFRVAWVSESSALEHLAEAHNYYGLLFSHDFAKCFWKEGARVTFMVPSATYTLRDKSGALIEVQRKPYTRRRLKPDAWKYHLRQMAMAEEPLLYIRRYVLVSAETEGVPAKRRSGPASS
jgi:hypothetical protein